MRRYTFISLILVLLVACTKKGDKVKPVPGKASLVFPAQSSLCTNGTTVSNTQSIITFSWNSTANTDTYELNVKNLLTGIVTTQSTSATQLQVLLDRATPYSWYIVSKSSATTTATQSDVWAFYNAGLGVTSYAPFPATLVYPGYGQAITSGSVTLSWTGSDVDGDITGYDVYFDTQVEPQLLKSNTSSHTFDVTVKQGNTYFWKIVTRDANGNSSNSEVYQFKVN